MTDPDTVLVIVDELTEYIAQVAANLVMVRSDMRTLQAEVDQLGAVLDKTVDSLSDFIVQVIETRDNE